MNNQLKCSECENSKTIFCNYYIYRRHIKKFHPDKLDTLAPLKKNNVSYKFSCPHCNKRFNYKHHLNFHLKTHGEMGEDSGKRKRKCPLCDYVGPSKDQLCKHFNTAHGFVIEEEQMQFSNLEEFMEWKSQFEKETRTKFIKSRGSTPKRSYFICHRSGNFLSGGKGLRHLKAQGSNKINSYCPAQIKVLVKNDDSVDVRIVKNHVGHINELCHLNLTQSERIFLAEKIAANVPFSDILEQIRSSVSSEDLERIHLVTKKDLYNITAMYNLHPASVKTDHNKTVENEVVLEDSNENGYDTIYAEITDLDVDECLFEEELKKYKEEVLDILSNIKNLEELQACKNVTDCIPLTLDELRTGSTKYEIIRNSDEDGLIEEQQSLTPKVFKICRVTDASISYTLLENDDQVS